jgi:hypothetical protein
MTRALALYALYWEYKLNGRFNPRRIRLSSVVGVAEVLLKLTAANNIAPNYVVQWGDMFAGVRPNVVNFDVLVTGPDGSWMCSALGGRRLYQIVVKQVRNGDLISFFQLWMLSLLNREYSAPARALCNVLLN